MKTKALYILFVLAVCGSAAGQSANYSIFNYSHFIPRVTINDRAVALQQSLFPELYNTRSVTADMRWVSDNDSMLATVWRTQGDTILHILRELSGIEWRETQFEIYLVRFYPGVGSPDPLIIPLGGLYKGPAIEIPPEGSRMMLNLVYQLSRRMLAQVFRSNDSGYSRLAYHPLMQPGPYRFDNVAWLLTLAACQNIIGADSTYDAYRSAYWKNRTPGRQIFEKYLMGSWTLTSSRTLVDWLRDEPANSALVQATRAPRRQSGIESAANRKFIEGLPLKGEFGFSVTLDDNNQLVVDKIDNYRLAYTCGLRTGDVIRRVNGRLVKNQKKLMEYLLADYARGGAPSEILRNGLMRDVVIQPMQIPIFMDDSDEFYYEQDSVSVDSTSVNDGDGN